LQSNTSPVNSFFTITICFPKYVPELFFQNTNKVYFCFLLFALTWIAYQTFYQRTFCYYAEGVGPGRIIFLFSKILIILRKSLPPNFGRFFVFVLFIFLPFFSCSFGNVISAQIRLIPSINRNYISSRPTPPFVRGN